MLDLARDGTDGAGDSWIEDSKVGTVDCRRERALDNGVQGLGVSDFGFQVSDFGCPVADFGFQIEGFGIRMQGFGFRVSGFWWRVSGIGLLDEG
jgi:hypothetical protein